MDESIIVIIIGVIVGVVIYFLPSIVAWNNRHIQSSAIYVLNFLLGWSLIGWIIALIWACIKPAPPQTIITNNKLSTADEIQKLADLKEKGIITEEEFNAKKAQILGL